MSHTCTLWPHRENQTPDIQQYQMCRLTAPIGHLTGMQPRSEEAEGLIGDQTIGYRRVLENASTLLEGKWGSVGYGFDWTQGRSDCLN